MRSIKTAALLAAFWLLGPGDAVAKDVSIVPVPKLECGTYTARGRLRNNERGDYILSLNEKTDSPSELILLGGDINTLTDRMDARVVVEFYVPKAIEGNDKSFVFLQSFPKEAKGAPDRKPTELPRDYIDLSKREPCGELARLKQ